MDKPAIANTTFCPMQNHAASTAPTTAVGTPTAGEVQEIVTQPTTDERSERKRAKQQQQQQRLRRQGAFREERDEVPLLTQAEQPPPPLPPPDTLHSSLSQPNSNLAAVHDQRNDPHHPLQRFNLKTDWSCYHCGKRSRKFKKMRCFRCEPCEFNVCEVCFVAIGGVIETSAVTLDEPPRDVSGIRRVLGCFRTTAQEAHPTGKGQDQEQQQGQAGPLEQHRPQAENEAPAAQQTQHELQQQPQQQQQVPPGQPQPPPKAKKGKPSEQERSAAVRHALAGGLAGFLRRSGRNVAAPERPPPPEAAVVATDASREAMHGAKAPVAGMSSQPPPLPPPASTISVLQTAASAHVQHGTLAQQAANVASSSDDEAEMRLSGNARPGGKVRRGDLSQHSASSAASVHTSRHSQQQQSLQEQLSRAGSLSHSSTAHVAGTVPYGAGGLGVVRPQVGIGGVESSVASRRSTGRQNDLEPQQHREDAHWNSHMQVEEIGQSGFGGAGSSMSSGALPIGTNQGRQNTSGLQQSRGRQSDISAVKSQRRHSDSGVQQFHISSISNEDSGDLGQVVNMAGNARPGSQVSALRSDTSGDVSLVQGFGAQARQDLTDISSVPSAHGGSSRVREVNNARSSGRGMQEMVLDSASDDDDDDGPSGPTHYQVRSVAPPSRPAAARAATASSGGAVSSAAPQGGYGTPPANTGGIQPFSPVSVSSLSDDGPAMMGGKPRGPPTRTFQRNDMMMEESVESM